MNINTGILHGSQQNSIFINHKRGGGGWKGRPNRETKFNFNGNFDMGSFNTNTKEIKISNHLSYKPRSIVGRGLLGTKVFYGTFDGRNVAVKRIDIEDVNMEEVDLLLHGYEHENILKLYCTQETNEFYWIAMEICDYNLGNFFQVPALQQEINLKDILRQFSIGIQHLHKNGIIHRDVHPRNILIKKENGAWKVKISDIGIFKKLEVEDTRAEITIGLIPQDWTDLESIESRRSTKESDIYSSGFVFYYMITQGKFPQNGEIILNDFGSIESADENLSIDLIGKMLQNDSERRPTAEQILNHGYFWDTKRILQIFGTIIKNAEEETVNNIKNNLNRNSARIVYGNWKTKLDHPFIDDLKLKHNDNLKGECVLDLIKYILSVYIHLKDLNPEMYAFLGEDDEGFLKYWTEKFPKIISHIYIQLLDIF